MQCVFFHITEVMLACKFTNFNKNVIALPPPHLHAPSSVTRYVWHIQSTAHVRVVTLEQAANVTSALWGFVSGRNSNGRICKCAGNTVPAPFPLPLLHTCMNLTLPIPR